MTADSAKEIIGSAQINCKLRKLGVHERHLGPSQLVINVVAEMTILAILLFNEKELDHVPNIHASCNFSKALKCNRSCDIMVPGQK